MEPFVAKDGTEVPLRGIGRRYVQMIMDKIEVPPVPTYEARTVAGDVEVHPHIVKLDLEGNVVGTTLQTDEDWEMWNSYQTARTLAISKRMEEAMKFLLCECVALDPPPLEDWKVNFEAWGLTPPDSTDQHAVKLFWIENELLDDPEDVAKLISRLYVIGGIVGEDQASNLERFFRLSVERLTTS